MKIAKHYPLTLAVALLFGACHELSPQTVGQYKHSDETSRGGVESEGDDRSGNERHVIQRAEVELVLKAYGPFRQELDDLLQGSKAILASSALERPTGSASSGTFVVRVPAAELEPFLGQIRELGIVTREQTTAEDVTEQYVDLEARLQNAKKTETRMVQILQQKTKSLKDIVDVERELMKVRETIESMEAKQRLWDSQVSLSTVTIRFSVEERYEPPRPLTLGYRVSSTFKKSSLALLDFGQGLVVAFVALIPWSAPTGLAGWGLVRTIRRRRRRD